MRLQLHSLPDRLVIWVAVSTAAATKPYPSGSRARMMVQPAKKRKIVYKDSPDAKAAELEEFLFGNKGNAADVFATRVEESEDDELTLTDLLAAKGSSKLFFEDKAGHDDATFQFSDEEEDDMSKGSSSESDQEEQAGSQGIEGESEEEQGEAAGDGTEQGSEEEEESEERGAPAAGTSVADGSSQHAAAAAAARQGGRRQPAWQDPDDAALQINVAVRAKLRKLRASHDQATVDGRTYEAALRKQHAAMHPHTAWASLNKARKQQQREAGTAHDADEEGLDGLLTQAGGLLAGRPARLAPGSIETTRLKDGNVSGPSNAVVQSVGWHPAGQLFMTAGLDKKLRLFTVDGVDNPLVQTVYIQDCPIHQASWASAGSQIVASGRRPYVYVYDLAAGALERVQPQGLPNKLKSLETFATTTGAGQGGHMLAFCGDQGYIPLMSLSSRQWVANLKMPGTVRCATWAPSGEQLLTLGSDGVIHTWEMRMRRCLSQVRDYGNNHPSSLAISPDGRYVASGSEAGVVNVYLRDPASGVFLQPETKNGTTIAPPASKPAAGRLGGGVSSVMPMKEVMNLTTSVDSLTFSHDSQMLALASRMKKDAMRLLHLPSCTVFANWPTSRSPLHYVHSVAFSPHSGFLSIGNARGRALLYRLHHYQEA